VSFEERLKRLEALARPPTPPPSNRGRLLLLAAIDRAGVERLPKEPIAATYCRGAGVTLEEFREQLWAKVRGG